MCLHVAHICSFALFFVFQNLFMIQYTCFQEAYKDRGWGDLSEPCPRWSLIVIEKPVFVYFCLLLCVFKKRIQIVVGFI